MLHPRLVLLDELMAGLSLTELEVVQGAVEHLARNGVTFLVVEHLMGVIRRLSHHLVVMDAGQIVTEGDPVTVIRDPRVVAAYLGDEAETDPGSRGLPCLKSQASEPATKVSRLSTASICPSAKLRLSACSAPMGPGNRPCCVRSCDSFRSGAAAFVFLGHSLTGAKAFVPAHHGMGYVPEGRGMLASLTVRENLEMGAYPLRAQPSFAVNLERVLALFPALISRLEHPAGDLSGGQAQMLAIGRAIMGSPKLLLLDEPSFGLAPQIVGQVYAVLGQLKAAGQAILLVEQTVGKALALSDRAYVLDRGRVVLSGPCEEVKNDKLLRDAYLGL